MKVRRSGYKGAKLWFGQGLRGVDGLLEDQEANRLQSGSTDGAP